MSSFAAVFLAVLWCSAAQAFVLGSGRGVVALRAAASVRLSSSTQGSGAAEEALFSGIAVSGFVEKEKNFADPFVFSKLFHSGRWKSITTVTDDTAFAKKRLVNPNTVYSGLIDVIKYAEVKGSNGATASADWSKALEGNEAWLAYGVTSAELPALAEVAANQKLKRVVFAVKVSEGEMGADVIFADVCKTLADAGVSYTLFKYSQTRKMGEAKFPYRIVRGVLPMPTEGQVLSSDDLMRVLVESVDIPKTFNAVYGVGPGSVVDAEILVYMKSQSWPERVQVGLLVGDMMEKLEVKFAEEAKNRETRKTELAAKSSAPAPTFDPLNGNKYAGFFK